MNYVELFEEAVARFPNRIAMVDSEGAHSITYAELDHLSALAAGKIHSFGLGKGDFVLIYMGRRLEYFVAYLGILKAGCAVVPTVPDYPEERIESIRQNCDSRLTITEDFFCDIEQYSPFCAPAEGREGSLLLYTSGSTGKPKGILHSAADMARAARRAMIYFTELDEIVVASVAMFSFIVHQVEFNTPFVLGATIHIVPDDIRKSAAALEDFYSRFSINFSFISPQMMRVLHMEKLTSLKTVMMAGERLSNVYSESFRIINGYGMSEVSHAVCFRVDHAYANTPVGFPMEGVEIRICNDTGRILPDGEEGEIWICGCYDTVYYKDPKRTAAAMIPLGDGRTAVKSGDIGYKDEKGRLVYVNRKDWMVKVNGQRVEPLEIESLITQMPEIQNAAVKGFEDANEQSYLAAFYVVKTPISGDTIRARLREKLPEYMIPRFFEEMRELPKNPNGKLDRMALAAPDLKQYKSAYAAPENETQDALCRAFSAVLHCGKVGINDDFFALGGDSIKVMMAVTATELPGLTMEQILEGKTPAGIAELYAQADHSVMQALGKIPEICPLTEAQRGIFLDSIASPDSVKYNIPLLFHLPAGTDRKRLIAALQTLIAQHPLFSVNVRLAKDGVPSMYYQKKEISVAETDTSDLLKTARSLICPFDLERDTLCRFNYLHSDGEDALFIDIHHIIFDGTSVGLFAEQLAAAYRGEAIPQEAFTQFDIAMQEAEPVSAEDIQAYRTFFSERLSDAEWDTGMRPDQLVEDGTQEAGLICISSDEQINAERIADFLRANRLTENALLLGSFGYALAKLCGTKHSCFTTASSGRSDVRLASSVGMFVKTIPLALRIDEDQTPAAFLRQVMEDYAAEKNNRAISFAELAEDYGVNTEVSAIFQSFFFRDVALENGRMHIESLTTGESVSSFEFMAMKKASGYDFNIFYQKSEYTETFISNFVNLFVRVVNGMLTARRLADISLVDVKTRSLLDAINATEEPYQEYETVVEAFRAAAEKYPANTCLVCKQNRYTYAEVDRLTDALAAYLMTQGVGRNKVVGILIPRTEFMLLGALGVLKAGGAYLPMDPTYPPERLNMMVQDSDAMFLLTTPALSAVIDATFSGQRMMTEDVFSLPPCCIDLPKPKPDDMFVILYTSGSTGLPKGVIYRHSNPLVTVAWEKKFYQLDCNSRVTAYASFGFDANVFDMYPAVISGAELHIIPEDIRLDFIALRDYFNENGITHTVMTTQVGRQFSQMEGLKTLKSLSVAGEKLTPPDPPADFAMYNLYGPTEGSVITSAFRIDAHYKDVPIGRPVDNLKLYIVDLQGRLLPPYSAGELWIAGPHVTFGYLNRPEKTAEAFRDNPFDDTPGYERVYRTGDIVRLCADGNLQFIGRQDEQVKVRGFRVELTEVEEVIRRFTGIKDAAVAAFDDPAGGKFIAAYVVSDTPVDVEALHAFIRAEKPPYMVPAVTMQIDRIPLNQNQKVNRKALPRPERKAEHAVPPENETQQKIFDIIADVIGHRAFGIDTDLQEAGLTSIGTLKLNVQLGAAFAAVMKLDDLKKYNTVRKLETMLSHTEPSAAYEIQTDYPITQTQRGIFIECSLHPGAVTYNIPIVFRLDETVDTDRLALAVRKAFDAHPYIKTSLFADESGDIRARRNDEAEAKIDVVSCDALPQDLVTPYELLNAPLYRAAIYKTPEGNYLFLDFHHIISDGTSEAILLSDIEKAYAGETLKTETYTGFEAALDEEKARASERLAAAKAYYDSVFTGCEENCLPPKAPEHGAGGAASITQVCKTNMAAVQDYCAQNKLTPNAFFNAAFGFALSRFVQFEDVVYTTVYHGRNDSRLSSVFSMLVKTLPVLVKTGENRTIFDLIRDTQTQLMDSMANDLFSFAEIANAYSIRSDIIFVYQGDTFTFDTLCGAPAEFVNIQPQVAKAPLTVNVYVKNGSFELAADYLQEMYSASFMQSFLNSFDRVLSEFTEKMQLSEVSLLSEEAVRRLETINDTVRPFENVPAHTLFERYAALHPDKPAVIGSGKRLTFGELNRKANRIAHALISLGVKTNTVVGMVLERTPEISLVELAIVKAGGAFLGLLPSYPDERIDFCLRDASSPIVITTEECKEKKAALRTQDTPYRAFTVEELLENDREENPSLSIPPDSLCYSIYTSGSTGKPKGVMIEHRNLVCCAQPFDFDYRYYCGDRSGDVGLALSSISFDMSIFDNLMLLMNGKTVCIATEEEIHNPVRLAQLMIENGVTMVTATPSILTNYISIPQFREAVEKLHAVVVGAEAFPAALYSQLKDINRNLFIINGYGPTECTMTCCSKLLTDSRTVTIGGPAANTAFYVLDRFSNILPPYACGELIICGNLVGRGYINLPEKTKASFFTLNGLPAYRSGDTVRLNADGEVEIFGRMDNQIKLRGFRVELDEIETMICAYPGVKQSKVIVRGSGAGAFLAGYFTAEDKVQLSELTAHLKTKLAYYMVPDALMQLNAMPLTPSGKVDKKALPEIQKENRKTGRRAAKKSLEQELCELFASVLSLDECYADDNFFEMGGTSLTASKVTMQLMSKGSKVEYQDIFDHPTPETLAAFIEAQRGTAKGIPAQEASQTANEYSELLQYNTLTHADEVQRTPLGDVLLTGAVGFLGIHVLRELLDRNEGKILCLVRKAEASSPETRLKNMLMYYFGDVFPDAFANRIILLDLDITDDALPEKLKACSFDTLINCAACVKHYAADDVIERINVHGVENLIRAAREHNARMIQISTTSVPGVHTLETYKQQLKMHENELFVVDDMDNKYCISKYHAEIRMLEAIRDGLRGKIIRVGNLMGRHSDGEFQINFNTNAFLNALRGFATIGKCPISHSTDPMSFSPIDLTARAIVLLSGTNDQFTAFHANNRFSFDEMHLIESANRCGVKIVPVDDAEYYADYYRLLGDETINSRLSGLVTNDRPDLHAVETDNIFTANVLYRLGFSWPFMDGAYLDRTLESLLTLDYFALDED